jgi:hypothetical protein
VIAAAGGAAASTVSASAHATLAAQSLICMVRPRAP